MKKMEYEENVKFNKYSLSKGLISSILHSKFFMSNENACERQGYAWSADIFFFLRIKQIGSH